MSYGWVPVQVVPQRLRLNPKHSVLPTSWRQGPETPVDSDSFSHVQWIPLNAKNERFS